jgi:hypothetical protein
MPEGSSTLQFRIYTSSMAFTDPDTARHPLLTLTTRQASLHAADRQLARPQRPLVIPLRRRPLNRRRGPATGLPDDYPDRTHTGKRLDAYDHVTVITTSDVIFWAHAMGPPHQDPGGWSLIGEDGRQYRITGVKVDRNNPNRSAPRRAVRLAEDRFEDGRQSSRG